MLYLLFSIVCSTLIFILFKTFKRFEVNNTYAIVCNYIVASALSFFVAESSSSLQTILLKEWFFKAFFIGFLFVAIFKLMAITAQKLGVAKVSIAVKMSVVLPVIAGVFIYNENLAWYKVIAILLALSSVFMATYKREEPNKKALSKKLLLLPILLFFGSGFIDVFMKQAQYVWVKNDELALFSSVLFGTAFFWGILFGTREWFVTKIKPTTKDVFWGFLLGIPNFGSIYFLLQALDESTYPSAVLFPINNVSIVAFSALAGYFVFKESLSRLNIIGIFSGIISIVLFAYG